MPKLVLQPIVENSLKHGFEHKGGDGIIRINGRRENETVIFEIIDDGVGIKEDELSRIKNNLVTKFQQKRNSYGLFNVNNRLLLYFGKPYGVEIESVFGEFTCVRLVIPILNEPQN
jgi:two-component system sensor histidine kinase YesM